MERKQFTFYESFYRAIRKIKSKTARADILDAICAYALYGTIPDEDSIRPEAVIMIEMARPVLDAARKKAEGAVGKDGDKTQEGQGKDKSRTKVRAGKDGEKEKEMEKEKELEVETERKCARPGVREDFDAFWREYPKKLEKDQAWAEFQRVEEDLQVLLDALAGHKRSGRWLEEGGRYIPRAAQWLKQRLWLEKLAQSNDKVPMGPSGELGEAELAAIRMMLAEG
ncbi:MAG: hypothetical protein IJO45_06570 [Oscillospiraceae bacterium]|nr:hypothetical protein [Oscillospiraceae bacterium]